MPILAQEPSLHPAGLMDEGGVPVDAGVGECQERGWWVLYTKARQEKAVARDLLRYDIPFYLPLVTKTMLYRQRRIVASAPLFSGYVFLYGSERERHRALTTNRLSRILAVADPDELWRDLRQLKRLIAAGAPLTLESRLAPGSRVRVRRGPLVDLEGTVLSRRGQTRLVICVNFLQQGASVEIDDFLLEPIT
jgi:transcriptional antiterminator RfaH